MTTTRFASAFWTLAEAIAWVCTRDEECVAAVTDPASPEALRRVMWTYALKWFQPINEDGDFEGDPKPVSHERWVGLSSDDALRSLTAGGRSAEIRIKGLRVDSNRVEEISPAEFVDLEWHRTWGLWSSSRQARVWTLVQYARDDVMSKWPRPTDHQAKRAQAERRILDHLFQIMSPELQLSKEQARERCKHALPGFYAEAFERAWKRIPANLKLGRGKRPPRLRKAA